MNIFEELHQPESRKLEFKREFPAKSNILMTIVAFANGAGGKLILGISNDDRKIIGIKKPLLLEEKNSVMELEGLGAAPITHNGVRNVRNERPLVLGA